MGGSTQLGKPGCATQDILSLLPILIKWAHKGYKVGNANEDAQKSSAKIQLYQKENTSIAICSLSSERHLLGGRQGDAAVFH